LARAGAPDLRRDHETDLLEDPDVLLDAVEGEPERLGQLADRRRPPSEVLEDAPPGRVREGEERAVEGRVQCTDRCTIAGDTGPGFWARP
jgi:hypothetical protein